jgi:uncharacterized membrane protein YoaK (UPF0700 family)
MTGNMTQAVIDFVDIITKNPETADVATTRFSIYGPAIITFLLGAIVGAGAYKYYSFGSLLIPIAALIYLALSYPKDVTA